MPDDGTYTTITIDKGEAFFVSRVLQAIIDRMQAAKKAGGFSQDDMLFLIERWTQIGIHFQRGGGASRLHFGKTVKAEGDEYVEFAKHTYLADYKAHPTDTLGATTYDETLLPVSQRPKASDQFYKCILEMVNYTFSDNLLWRSGAFNNAEGGLLLMAANYRIRLSADTAAEAAYRKQIGMLRHGHNFH